MRRKGVIKLLALGFTVVATAAFMGGVLAVMENSMKSAVTGTRNVHCADAGISVSHVSLDEPWLNVTLKNIGTRNLWNVTVEAESNGSIAGMRVVPEFRAGSFEAVEIRIDRRPTSMTVVPATCPGARLRHGLE